MLFVTLKIENPYSKEFFRNVFNRSIKLFYHKFFEFEIIYHSKTILEFNLSFTTKRDHSGFELILGLMGISISFKILDSRHWDYENDRWEQI